MELTTLVLRTDLDEWTGPYSSAGNIYGYHPRTFYPMTAEEEEGYWRGSGFSTIYDDDEIIDTTPIVEIHPESLSRWIYWGMQVYFADEHKIKAIIEVVSHLPNVTTEQDLADVILSSVSAFGSPFTTDEDREYWSAFEGCYNTVHTMI